MLNFLGYLRIFRSQRCSTLFSCPVFERKLFDCAPKITKYYQQLTKQRLRPQCASCSQLLGMTPAVLEWPYLIQAAKMCLEIFLN